MRQRAEGLRFAGALGGDLGAEKCGEGAAGELRSLGVGRNGPKAVVGGGGDLGFGLWVCWVLGVSQNWGPIFQVL